VVELLRSAGHDCAVIERSPSAEAMEIARAARLPLLTGDVTTPRCCVRPVWREPRRGRVTSDDITNVEAGMGARSVAPDARVVLRLGDSDLALRVAQRLGLTVSRSVSFASAPVFAAALMGRSVLAAIPAARRIVLIAEVRLSAGCELVGSTVAAIDQPGRCRVFGVVGDPGGPTRLPDRRVNCTPMTSS